MRNRSVSLPDQLQDMASKRRQICLEHSRIGHRDWVFAEERDRKVGPE